MKRSVQKRPSPSSSRYDGADASFASCHLNAIFLLLSPHICLRRRDKKTGRQTDIERSECVVVGPHTLHSFIYRHGRTTFLKPTTTTSECAWHRLNERKRERERKSWHLQSKKKMIMDHASIIDEVASHSVRLVHCNLCGRPRSLLASIWRVGEIDRQSLTSLGRQQVVVVDEQLQYEQQGAETSQVEISDSQEMKMTSSLSLDSINQLLVSSSLGYTTRDEEEEGVSFLGSLFVWLLFHRSRRGEETPLRNSGRAGVLFHILPPDCAIRSSVLPDSLLQMLHFASCRLLIRLYELVVCY